MNRLIAWWEEDRLWGTLVLSWLFTVFASFFNSLVFPTLTVPLVGTLYLFRIVLPVTVVLYGVWQFRHRRDFWKEVSTAEKWCYALIAILLVYGGLSLLRAIDVGWTLGRLINLCFDLLYFFLALRLLKNPKVRRATGILLAGMLVLLCLLGIYEVFCGGVVDPKYDHYQRLELFMGTYQFPVVFSGNTNDYAMTLIYLSGVLMLECVQAKDSGSIRTGWIVLLALTLVFLMVASTARLNQLCLLILFLGLSIWGLWGSHRRRSLPLLLLCCILLVQFAQEYRYIVPKYVGSGTQTVEQAEAPVQRPARETLGDELYVVDEATGEKKFRTEGSAGPRALLLLHAKDCFLESYGLGVGLGNTEILARDREVIPNARFWSIHCFLARLTADYGVFALVPLCAVAALLFRKDWRAVQTGRRAGNRDQVIRGVFHILCLVIFPISSTASSDAQDCLPMWLYLGYLVECLPEHTEFLQPVEDEGER